MSTNEREDAAIPVVMTFFRTVYRPGCTRMLAHLYAHHVPTLQAAKGMPFEALLAKFAGRRVRDVCSRVIKRVIALINSSRARSDPAVTGTVEPQVFLCAYLIVSHPGHVIEVENDLSRALVAATEPMLECFEGFMDLCRGGVAWQDVRDAQGRELCALLCRYLRTFKAWKAVDEQRVAVQLKDMLVLLEDSAESLRGETGPAAALLPQMSNQVARIRSKLVAVAGQGTLDEYDRDRAAARAREEARRAQVMEGNFEPAGLSNEELAHELLLDPDFRLDDTMTKTMMPPPLQQEDDDDDDDNEPWALVRTRIRSPFTRTFWQALEVDLRGEAGTLLPQRVVSLLRDTKAAILGVCGSTGRSGVGSSPFQEQAEQAKRVIDIETLSSTSMRLDHGGGGAFLALIGSIVDIMASLSRAIGTEQQAARADDMLARWQALLRDAAAIPADDESNNNSNSNSRASWAALCFKALRFLAERTYTMRADCANRQLNLISAVVSAHGIEYERQHFRGKLESGTLTLASTDRWIRHSLRGVVAKRAEELFATVSLPGLCAGDVQAMQSLLGVAIVDLVADYPHWGGRPRLTRASMDDDLPAPLKLDMLRIRALNMHLHSDVMCAIVIDTVDAELERRLFSHDEEEEEQQRRRGRKEAALQAVARIVLKRPPHPYRPSRTLNLVMAELLALQGAAAAGMVAAVGHPDAVAICALAKTRLDYTGPAYQAMLHKFKVRWYEVMRRWNNGAPPPAEDLNNATRVTLSSEAATAAAAALLHESDRRAYNLGAMYQLTCRVHTRVYKDVIQAAVRAVGLVTTGGGASSAGGGGGTVHM